MNTPLSRRPQRLAGAFFLALVCLALWGAAGVFSQESIRQKWYAIEDSTAENTFSTSYTTVAKQTAVDAQGRVAISGNTANNREGKGIFTAKYDGETGALLWEQHYEGPNAADDVMAFMRMDAEGNVIVAGHSIPGSGAASHNPYWVILKYASDTGSLLWEKHWPSYSLEFSAPTDMAIDSAGRVILAGPIPGKYETIDGGILTFSPTDGSLLREWHIPSAYHVTVCVLPSGGVGVAAVLLGYASSISVRHLDEQGKEICRARVPSGNLSSSDKSTGNKIRLKSDAVGRLYLASPANSSSDTDGPKTYDYLISKLNAETGSILWITRCRGTLAGTNPACDLAVDSMGGGVFFSGISLMPNPASDRTPHGYLTLSLDPATGAIRWEKREDAVYYLGWQEKGVGNGPALLVDGRGHVLLGGQVSRPSSEDMGGLLIQYAATDGREIWRHFRKGTNTRFFVTVKSIAIDRAGEIVAAGSWQEKAFVAKHSGGNGTEYWQNFLTSSIYGDDRPLAVRMDHEGAVITATFPAQDHSTASEGFRLTKYAAADGSLAWKNPINFNESLISFDLDSAGDIFIIRPGKYIDSSLEIRQFHAEKYSGLDGSLLWTYDLPASVETWQTSFKILAGGKGGIFISSLLRTGSENRHMVTKLDGATGVPVWSTLSPQIVYSNTARFVALTPDGSVIAANTAVPSLDRQEPQLYYWLVKGDTGEVPWERFYENPPSGFDSYPTNILSDPQGNIVLAGATANRELSSYFLLKCRPNDGAAVWTAPVFVGPRPGASIQPVSACRNGDVLVQAGALLFRYAAATGTALWAKNLNASWVAENPSGTSIMVVNNNNATGRLQLQSLGPNGEENGFRILLPENFTVASSRSVVGPGGKIALHGTYQQYDDSDAAIAVYEPASVPEIPQPLSFELNPAGPSAHMTFAASPGHIYFVEKSQDLRDWITVAQAASGFDGVLEYHDMAPAGPRKYYRLRRP